MASKTKILIIDDSALVREALKKIFSSDEDLEVVGAVGDPYEAAKALRNVVPDVITLDLHMPRMDGLTFLKKLMSQHPIPVVVISSMTQSAKETALKALEYGAAEVITKPRMSTQEELETSTLKLCRSVKAASKANISNLKKSFISVSSKRTSGELPHPKASRMVIAMGASTGGTEAIKTVLQGLSTNLPGIVIVQHMPAGFTHQFAERLNNECGVRVQEAEDGDEVVPGIALIAPGDKHMRLKKMGSRYYVDVKAGELVNRHMPSVDVLFDSVAEVAKEKSIGVLMTGMGKDGAQGLLNMRNSGALTIAQDEASSVVFGMPKEAIRIGGAKEVVSLSKIAMKTTDLTEEKLSSI